MDFYLLKRHGFLPFAKSMGKNLSNKYSQKLLDTAKKSISDVINTASKIAILKRAEATGDLIGNKIADKITRVSKKTQNNKSESDSDSLEDVQNQRYTSLEERQQIIDELRLA